MNVEKAREFLLSLPHVLEAEQWGGLIYWVGDKAIGGKLCAMVNLEPGMGFPASYPAGHEHFAELVEREGIVPAPYLAKAFWVAIEGWGTMRDAEWQEEFHGAHARTYEKLPPKTKATLALPKAELKKVVAERKRVLAEREATKKGKG